MAGLGRGGDDGGGEMGLLTSASWGSSSSVTSSSSSLASSALWTEDDDEIDAIYNKPVTNRVYSESALCCLKTRNPVRRCAIWVVDSRLFDRFILLVILVNCVFLALVDPTQPKDVGFNRVVEGSEIAFTAIFTLEMVLKILAMGFYFSKYAYLRDPWNVLDFAVVMLGYAALIPGFGNYSGIRTFRVFRALRTLSSIQGLRVVVNALLRSLKPLGNVTLLLVFFCSVFSIVSMQLFSGVLRQRCVDPSNVNGTDLSADNICTTLTYGGRVCEAPASQCLAVGENPNSGTLSFDNYLYAMLTTLQLLTMDEWEGVLVAVLAATSGWSMVYFVFVIFIGAFFLINLVTAVVYSSYLSSIEQLFDEDILGARGGASSSSDPDEEAAARAAAAERAMKGPVYRCATSNALTTFVVVVICLNTVTLAMEYPGMPEGLTVALFWINVVFTIIFTVEMVLKMAALGFGGYFGDAFNTFDAVVVIISLVELVVVVVAYLARPAGADDAPLGATGSGSGLSVLRTFRLLRVFKLARSWTSLRDLLAIVAKSLPAVANLTVVLLVIMYVCALIGMQIFGGTYGALGPDRSRTDFDSFFESFISVFRIIIGEWTVPMVDAINATDTSAILYFVAVLLVGNYVVLNLFLSVLLSNFEFVSNLNAEAEANANSAPEPIPPGARCGGCRRCWRRTFEHCGDPPEEAEEDGDLRQGRRSGSLADALHDPIAHTFGDDDVAEDGNLYSPREGANAAFAFGDDNGSMRDIVNLSIVRKREAEAAEAERAAAAAKERQRVRLYGSALFVLAPDNGLRLRFRAFVEHPWFDRVVLMLIVCSSITLALDTPDLDPDSTRADVLFVLDIVFTILFSLEMLCKIVTYGLVGHYRAYLTSGWNRLDAAIVVVSIANLALGRGSDLGALKAIRTLRALRPLRAITRNEGMRVVVNALFQSIPAMGNVLLVCLLFWLIFGILGVQLFGGKFAYCDVAEAANRTHCADLDGQWLNPEVNFDNIFAAMLALFHVATFEGWYEVFYSAIDATDVDVQPVADNSPIAALFFIAFVVVGSFFVLNLFVGVVIDEFNRIKRRNDGVLLLTEWQERWLSQQRMILKGKLQKAVPPPSSACRRPFFTLVSYPAFDLVIMGLIMLNIVSMCMETYDMSDGYARALDVVNIVFTSLFTIEATVKLLGLGVRPYFKSGWNVFDFAIVVVSWVGIVVDLFAEGALPVNPTILRVLRVFRVARIFRLVKRAKGLKKLMMTLLYSLPSLINVGSLLFLVFFVYAVLGMNLFGDVALGDTLTESANFKSIGSALILLFRLCTASGWNEIFADAAVRPPDCDAAAGTCGNFLVAAAYFVSLLVIISILMVSLFVAVIMQNFEVAEDEERATVTDDDITGFRERWTQFDPDATYMIGINDLHDFSAGLDPPLGFKGDLLTPDDIDELIIGLDVPVHNGKVHFIEVLLAMTRRVNASADLPPELQERMERTFRDRFPNFRAQLAELTTRELVAGARILVWYRAYRLRKDAEKAAAAAAAASGGDGSGGGDGGGSSSSSISGGGARGGASDSLEDALPGAGVVLQHINLNISSDVESQRRTAPVDSVDSNGLPVYV